MSKSGAMVEPQQKSYGEGPRTARSDVVRGSASMQVTTHRVERRQVEIEKLSDIIPTIRAWLAKQDSELITLAEQKTGLDREKLFFGLCGVLAVYMIIGPANGFLCNLVGFAYPAFESVRAIRTEDKEDDTQWLIYWTTFASFSLLDVFALQTYNVMALYWILKLAFLLYLALPQTMGAHNMYVSYVDPLFDWINAKLGTAY